MKKTIQLGARLPVVQKTDIYFMDIDTGNIGACSVTAWPGDFMTESDIVAHIQEIIFDEINERKVNIRLVTADEFIKCLAFEPEMVNLELANNYAFYPERGPEIIRPSCQAIFDHIADELKQKNTSGEIPKKEEKPKIDLNLLVH